MARIVKAGSRYNVVNSINGVPVKGGRGLTRREAERVKREVVRRNCGARGQHCKTR